MTSRLFMVIASFLLVGKTICSFANYNNAVDQDFLQRLHPDLMLAEEIHPEENDFQISVHSIIENDFNNLGFNEVFLNFPENPDPIVAPTFIDSVNLIINNATKEGHCIKDDEAWDISKWQNVKLPLGFYKLIKNYEVTIAIISTYFAVDFIQMDMLAKIEWVDKNNTEKKNTMLLGAWGVKSYYDTGLPQEAKFVLLKDVEIPLSKTGENNNGSTVTLTLNGNFDRKAGTSDLGKATYVSLGCGGLKSINGHFVGNISFDKESEKKKIKKVVREGEKFLVYPDSALVIPFKTDASLDNFYFSVFPEESCFFTYDSTDFIFELSNINVDYSSSHSNPVFMTSSNYDDKTIFWEGVYIERVAVYLPKEYSAKNATGRISIHADHLIVDQYGLTVSAGVGGLKNITDGEANGWPIYLDSVKLGIYHNNIDHIRLRGGISPSIMKDTTFLEFAASWQKINQISQYLITIDYSDGKKSLGVWDAQLENFNATVLLAKDTISATFNGSVGFSGEVLSNLKVRVVDLTVGKGGMGTHLSIDNVKFIMPEGGFKGGFDNFPITIGYGENNEILFSNNTLKIPIGLNLMADKIGGGTEIQIKCETKEVDGRTRFRLKSIDVNEISISASLKAFSLDGTVTRYKLENPDGTIKQKGFSGNLAMVISTKGDIKSTSGNLTVAAEADFGSMQMFEKPSDYFNYWHVGIKVSGLNVNLGGPVMTGIGGGAAYHMKPDGIVNAKPKFTADEKMGLYVSCNTLIKLTPAMPESQAGFEIQFNNNWGLYYVALFANINLTPDLNSVPGLDQIMDGYKAIAEKTEMIIPQGDSTSSSLTDITLMNSINEKLQNKIPFTFDAEANRVEFKLLLHANVTKKEIYGEAKAYINIGGILKGDAGTTGQPNSDGYAGAAYFYIGDYMGENTAFFHLGYKEFDYFKEKTGPGIYEPLSVGLVIPGFFDASASAYFLTGTTIPYMPHPRIILKENPPAIIEAAYNQLANGTNLDGNAGVAFGSAVVVKISPSFGIIYSDIKAFVGFSVLLQYLDDYYCPEWKKDEFGFNNWYAQGMAYAGLAADIGIRINVFKMKKSFSILKGELNAVMTAKLPNPTWFAGTVGGNYSLLSGKVKGQFSLQANIGTNCEFVEKEEDKYYNYEVPIIYSIQPADQQTLSPMGHPEIVFNYDFNKPFYLSDELTDGLPMYKFDCSDFSAYYVGQSGVDSVQVENLQQNWEGDKKLKIGFNQQGSSWGQNKLVRMKLQIKMLMKKPNEEEWTIATLDSIAGQEIQNFKIDTTFRFTITDLPDEIALSEVKNIYPIIDNQYHLIEQSDQGMIELHNQGYLIDNINMRIDFVESKDTTKVFSAFAMGIDKSIHYTIPDGLTTGSSYKVKIIQLQDNQQEKEIFAYTFSTSIYTTFKQKVENMNSLISIKNPYRNNIQSTFEYNEPFGEYELLGSKYYNNGQPLVKAYPVISSDSCTLYTKVLSYLLELSKLDGSFVPQNEKCTMGDNAQKIMCHIESEPIPLKYNSWQKLKDEMIFSSLFPFVFDRYGVMSDIIEKANDYVSLCPEDIDQNELLKQFLSKYKAQGLNCSYQFPAYFEECQFPIRLEYGIGTNSQDQRLVLKYNNITI